MAKLSNPSSAGVAFVCFQAYTDSELEAKLGRSVFQRSFFRRQPTFVRSTSRRFPGSTLTCPVCSFVVYVSICPRVERESEREER